MKIETPYWLRISQKNYNGTFSTIILGETPFNLSQQTDNIRATVRGNAIEVSIKNTGSIPIETFQSVNDDEFLVEIGTGNDTLFVGFVVQDDSSELMADYTHDIVLQVNDNLGLLKDVAFNLDNSVIADFYARNTLAAIIHQCLKHTGLELETYVYANIWEDRMSEADSFLPQCSVDCNMFINGSSTDINGKTTDTFMSCYEVLDRILDRFNMSLFQAYGRWNIVRWDELRGLTTIHAFVYDKDWNLIDSKLLPDAFTAGPVIGGMSVPDMFPENGLERQKIRPFLFDRETFNYVQPKYLLKNYDLQTLGALIRTYVDTDGNSVSEYVATGWTAGWGANIVTRYIRVVSDAIGNEITRYLVLVGPTSDSPRAVQGVPFEVTKGGKIKFSFSVMSADSFPGQATINFAVRLFDGTTNRYVDEVPAGNGNWIPGVGFNYQIAPGDNLASGWHSVEISSSQIPFDGLLFVYLNKSGNNGNEFRYSDIRVEYTQFINDSTKIIGHIHKATQTDAVAQKTKNNEDVTIYIDDSPSNQAVGTLFLPTFHGLVQDRTARWHRAGSAESKRLGEIMTGEILQWRSITRTKLEGTFYGLVQNAMHLSLLLPIKHSALNPLRFIFGRIEIDFRNNRVKCTAWELTGQAGEFNVNQLYTFTYLYSTK